MKLRLHQLAIVLCLLVISNGVSAAPPIPPSSIGDSYDVQCSVVPNLDDILVLAGFPYKDPSTGYWDQNKTGMCYLVSLINANIDIGHDVMAEVVACLDENGYPLSSYINGVPISAGGNSPIIAMMHACKMEAMEDKGTELKWINSSFFGGFDFAYSGGGGPCEKVSNTLAAGGGATVTIILNDGAGGIAGAHQVQVTSVLCGPPGVATIQDPNGQSLVLTFDGAGNIGLVSPGDSVGLTGGKIVATVVEEKK